MGSRRTPLRILAAAALTCVAGCGSQAVADLPAPAGPPRSPAPDAVARAAIAAAGAGADQQLGAGKREDDLGTSTADIVRGSRRISVTLPDGPALVGGLTARATAHGVRLSNGRSATTGGRVTSMTAMDDGHTLVVLDGQAREVSTYAIPTLRRKGKPAPAGVGPTQVLCRGKGPCYVADTAGDGLLVLTRQDGPALRTVRWLQVRGGPLGMAIDPSTQRLWVALPAANRVAELPATRNPHVLRSFGAPPGGRQMVLSEGRAWLLTASGAAHPVTP